jgi:hypothetical protein
MDVVVDWWVYITPARPWWVRAVRTGASGIVSGNSPSGMEIKGRRKLKKKGYQYTNSRMEW